MAGKRKPRRPPARRLLTAVADALNACEQAGISVKLRHGIVDTCAGYVMPLAGDRWATRTRRYTEFTPADDGDDD